MDEKGNALSLFLILVSLLMFYLGSELFFFHNITLNSGMDIALNFSEFLASRTFDGFGAPSPNP